MGVGVRIAPDDATHRVRFDRDGKCVLQPGGIRILAALDHAANVVAHDVTVTSAADGTHTGPTDPHPNGRAFDFRTHDLPDKHLVLKAVKDFLEIPDGPDLGAAKFFAWIENEDGPNEHGHVQVRHGMEYP